MFINLTKTEVEETVTALEETKWIPCNERMPKGTVLCCDDRGENHVLDVERKHIFQEM